MTSKDGRKRKRERLLRLTSFPLIPPCTATRDQIHRDQDDAVKCRECRHHHCRACGVCMRCRRYGDERCRFVNAEKVPIVESMKPKGAPWWRKNRAAAQEQPR